MQKKQTRDPETLNRLSSRHHRWENKAELGHITNEDIIDREEVVMDIMFLGQQERHKLKQRGRINWVIEGDENSGFFHAL